MFCFTSNENCFFLRKNGETAKRVVDFPRERDTFRNKIMEIVEDFDETSHNNNGKPWKSSRNLRLNPMFFIFLSFFHHFSSFFHFFIFHILSFSLIFFHFLSFSLSLLGAQNLIFLGLNFVTISLDSSYEKQNKFWANLGWYPFGPSFPFFPPFFSRFLFFLAF